MPDLVRVTSSPLYPFYAPAYLAQTLGCFRDLDLIVDTSIPAGPGSSWLADNLHQGKADVAMGGIWIPLTYRGRLGTFPIFLRVCSRNPQALMAREPVGKFDWSMLYGRKVLLPMSSTSQWMFLEGAMKEAGVEIGRVTFLRDLDIATTTNLWRAGLADFYLIDPPLIEQLEEEGFTVATTLAQSCGPVPWTVYYTTPAFFEREGDVADRFRAAIAAALVWLHGHDDSEVSAAIAEFFPAVPPARLARAIGRLRANGIWSQTPAVGRDSFMRYQKMIAEYGLIDHPFSFDETVTGADEPSAARVPLS
jgi:NitT/TauT family transport system substrate-binding protein